MGIQNNQLNTTINLYPTHLFCDRTELRRKIPVLCGRWWGGTEQHGPFPKMLGSLSPRVEDGLHSNSRELEERQGETTDYFLRRREQRR
jgi:hypothetical protein